MLKRTDNNYIHVTIPKEETDKEKLLGLPAQAYKAIVILDSSGKYKTNDLIYVTKAGLMPVEIGCMIHLDRVLGLIEEAN